MESKHMDSIFRLFRVMMKYQLVHQHLEVPIRETQSNTSFDITNRVG